MYDPSRSPENYCWPGSGSKVLNEPAYFGQFKCDPPEALVRVLFDKIKSDNTDIDFILLTGDYVAHAVALEPPPETSF